MSAFVLVSLFLVSTSAVAADDPVEPEYFTYRILETYPHDTNAFTQGLFFEDGVLFESTGQYGQSSLRRVDKESGEVVQKRRLPQSIFGEGSTVVGDDIFVLSWREGTAFRFDEDDFTLEQSYGYEGEGWGLTFDGEALIMSDGTATLRFVDPRSFEVSRRMTVTLRGRPLPQLNELEYVDDQIFANVWQTNAIVRIDPSSGVVTGIVDMRGLLAEEDFVPGETDVLNGIAWNGEDNILYVTGKNWPKLFKVELVATGD
ncbi:MAG: glutaminyl-peptide cyclotransferase [Pseudomonadota bacterium]